jgi:hypothetical protein
MITPASLHPYLCPPEHDLERTSLRKPGTMILKRLDEVLLGHGSRGPAGSGFVDDPPGKLLLLLEVLDSRVHRFVTT